jgi:hypothetical protein
MMPFLEGPVPRRLTGATACGPLIQATADAALLAVPRVGRFLVGCDGAVLVERADGAADADLRCFLDEPVAALAAQLRGDLVLRAAAVSIEGRAVALCGAPAAGKSALAAALAQRGHAVLADAVTSVSDGAAEGSLRVTRAWTAEPQLWPDTIAELGLSPSDGRLVRPGLAKRAYPLASDAELTPLAAVVDLHAQRSRDRMAVEPLAGAAAVHAVLGLRWHARLAGPLGLEPAQFQLAASVAASASCVRLLRPWRGVPAGELAARVEEMLA